MTKEEFYDQGIVKINEIYQIFKDHFTEDRVDLRNIISKERFCNRCSTISNGIYNIDDDYSPYIIVHFPEVTITNEYNDSVTIKDLWAKVVLTYRGTMKHGFLLNRSHYPISHWKSDYMHSHIPGIPKDNMTKFLSPCLGTGPIRDTISSLISGYDELLWQLFCRELEVYVTVESIAGVPYRRLKNIGDTSYRSRLITYNSFLNYYHYNYNSVFSKSLLKRFIKHLIDNKYLKFNFNDTSYSIAMSSFDYYISISNIFINWYNELFNNKEINELYSDLIANNVIFKVDIINNNIYHSSTPIINNENGGALVLTFKDKPINLVIEDDDNETIENSHILNPSIATAILRSMLALINYKYGREENRNTEGTDNTSNTQYRIIL